MTVEKNETDADALAKCVAQLQQEISNRSEVLARAGKQAQQLRELLFGNTPGNGDGAAKEDAPVEKVQLDPSAPVVLTVENLDKAVLRPHFLNDKGLYKGSFGAACSILREIGELPETDDLFGTVNTYERDNQLIEILWASAILLQCSHAGSDTRFSRLSTNKERYVQALNICQDIAQAIRTAQNVVEK